MTKFYKLLTIGLIGLYPLPSIANDDYKKITDQAYCSGVYRERAESAKRSAIIDDLAIQSYLNKHSKAKAYVEGAIERGQFDERSAKGIGSIGYADSDSCNRERLSLLCDFVRICE